MTKIKIKELFTNFIPQSSVEKSKLDLNPTVQMPFRTPFYEVV